MEATIDSVALELGRQVNQQAVVDSLAINQIVSIARKYGGDAGLACLAGFWIAKGMPEHEIVARLWPLHGRFEVVK